MPYQTAREKSGLVSLPLNTKTRTKTNSDTDIDADINANSYTGDNVTMTSTHNIQQIAVSESHKHATTRFR